MCSLSQLIQDYIFGDPGKKKKNNLNVCLCKHRYPIDGFHLLSYIGHGSGLKNPISVIGLSLTISLMNF